MHFFIAPSPQGLFDVLGSMRHAVSSYRELFS